MNSAIKRFMQAIAILPGLILATTAGAHHSFGMFDFQREVTLSGKIVEFQWTNPHTWTWIDVKNETGGSDKWGLEGMSPNFLGRRGWSRNSLKPGDEVTLVIYPLKNGENGGTLLRVMLPNGETLVMFGRPAGGPAAPPPQ